MGIYGSIGGNQSQWSIDIHFRAIYVVNVAGGLKRR